MIIKSYSHIKNSTLKKLLLTALQPVGSTMYVWGGGWNSEDTGAGQSTRTIGVSPRWNDFFQKQTKNYDFHTTRYQINDGLDCSGYIGWCIYNILHTQNGENGYVMPARKMAKTFASLGFGRYRDSSQVVNYCAGDIMSSKTHVWLVIGACSDGSVVLLHSSPPGVRIAGTPSKTGQSSSEAVNLAAFYMKCYFPKWYTKYPDCTAKYTYLTDYAQMRWDTSGRKIMTDPNGYQNIQAKEILTDLFRPS